MDVRRVGKGDFGRVGAVRRKRSDTAVSAVSGVSPVAGVPDRVEFSAKTDEVHRARTFAIQAPEVREDRIDAILSDLREGRYAVSGREVVPLLLRDHMMLSGRSLPYGSSDARI